MLCVGHVMQELMKPNSPWQTITNPDEIVTSDSKFVESLRSAEGYHYLVAIVELVRQIPLQNSKRSALNKELKRHPRSRASSGFAHSASIGLIKDKLTRWDTFKKFTGSPTTDQSKSATDVNEVRKFWHVHAGASRSTVAGAHFRLCQLVLVHI